jgi:hypothetical protein
MTIRPTLFFVSLLVASSMLALMGCGGGGSSGTSGPIPCNVGTLVQLASPTQGQTGVSTTNGQVIIVADGNTNTLFNTYTQWIITLVDNTGQPWTGASLRLVADPSGPHPYPSDFFYASTIATLIAGRTYSASLSEPGNACQPISLGAFST